MNLKPVKPVKTNPRSKSARLGFLAVGILIASVLIIDSGCSDSTADVPAKPSAAISNRATVQPNDNLQPDEGPEVEMGSTFALETKLVQEPDTQDPETKDPETKDSETEEAVDGILGKASHLFEKAKSASGNSASGASQWVQDKFNGATEAGGQTADETWKWANDTFESLKAQGLTSATDTSEWLGQDWHNMESWEYKVVTLSGSDDELAEQLNAFGKQGWNCFNTETKADGIRFYFKKPTFSYLRNMPFKDFLKLVPMMTNGGN